MYTKMKEMDKGSYNGGRMVKSLQRCPQNFTYITLLYGAYDWNSEDTGFCRKLNISFQVLVKLQMIKF